jgi:hypothetical protein
MLAAAAGTIGGPATYVAKRCRASCGSASNGSAT